MKNMIVEARELRYAGKTLLRGDPFEASDKDARILKAIRKAKDADLDAAAPSPRTRPQRVPRGRAGEMQFQSAPTTGQSVAPLDTTAGLYNRRDMRAED